MSIGQGTRQDSTENGKRQGEFVLVMALAAGSSIKDAALAARVGERTVHRRLEDADFRAEVSRVRGEMMAQAVGQLADCAVEAVTTMRDLARSAESETVRLGAARALLELGAKLYKQSGEAAHSGTGPDDILALVTARPSWPVPRAGHADDK